MQHERDALASRMDIFWTFLEETAAVLERNRLRKVAKLSPD